MRNLPLVALLTFPLALGCASSEKSAAKAPPPAAPAEGKPGAAMDVTLGVQPGANPASQRLVLDVVAHRDLPGLSVEFRLPAGVTAVDAAALNGKVDAPRAHAKHTFQVDVTLDAAAQQAGADVTAVAVIPWGGVNRDSVTRIARVGPAAPAAAAQPGTPGVDGTGQPIHEVRPGK